MTMRCRPLLLCNGAADIFTQSNPSFASADTVVSGKNGNPRRIGGKRNWFSTHQRAADGRRYCSFCHPKQSIIPMQSGVVEFGSRIIHFNQWTDTEQTHFVVIISFVFFFCFFSFNTKTQFFCFFFSLSSSSGLAWVCASACYMYKNNYEFFGCHFNVQCSCLLPMPAVSHTRCGGRTGERKRDYFIFAHAATAAATRRCVALHFIQFMCQAASETKEPDQRYKWKQNVLSVFGLVCAKNLALYERPTMSSK